MKAKSAKILLGAVLIVGPVAVAQAQGLKMDYGWYAGISIGGSQERISDSALTVSGATASTLNKDETGTGFKVFGGYQFNRNFALEGGYIDFGKFRATRTVTAPAALAGSATADLRSTGWGLDAVGILPLQSGFSLFGKLGAIYTTTDTSLATTGGIVAGGGSAKRRDWDWKWGFGASYDFGNKMSLRLEFEDYNDVPNDNVMGKADLRMWSLGLIHRY